jgi:hypothetical protein
MIAAAPGDVSPFGDGQPIDEALCAEGLRDVALYERERFFAALTDGDIDELIAVVGLKRIQACVERPLPRRPKPNRTAGHERRTPSADRQTASARDEAERNTRCGRRTAARHRPIHRRHRGRSWSRRRDQWPIPGCDLPRESPPATRRDLEDAIGEFTAEIIDVIFERAEGAS